MRGISFAAICLFMPALLGSAEASFLPSFFGLEGANNAAPRYSRRLQAECNAAAFGLPALGVYEYVSPHENKLPALGVVEYVNPNEAKVPALDVQSFSVICSAAPVAAPDPAPAPLPPPATTIALPMTAATFNDPKLLEKAAADALAETKKGMSTAGGDFAVVIAVSIEGSVDLAEDATKAEKATVLSGLQAVACEDIPNCSVQWAGEGTRRRRLGNAATSYKISIEVDASEGTIPTIEVTADKLNNAISTAAPNFAFTIASVSATETTVAIEIIVTAEEGEEAPTIDSDVLKAVADSAGVDVSLVTTATASFTIWVLTFDEEFDQASMGCTSCPGCDAMPWAQAATAVLHAVDPNAQICKVSDGSIKVHYQTNTAGAPDHDELEAVFATSGSTFAGVSPSYSVRTIAKGRQCAMGYALESKAECESVLPNYSFGGVKTSSNRPSGCFVTQRMKKFYNPAPPTKSKVWKATTAICKSGDFVPTPLFMDNTKKGRNCPSVKIIASASTCERAANSLGRSFKKSVFSKTRPAGCYFRGKKAWYNNRSVVYPKGRYGKFTGLCKV